MESRQERRCKNSIKTLKEKGISDLTDCFSNFASHYILTFDFSYLRKKVARVAHLYCIPIMRSIEVFKNSKMIVVC